ncbi:MAG TPA: hypothetical protein VNU93_02100 [Verrucomicrobiae bacterium]|nr:hypothetical protein [Verrucomicrobiae bacterium]
MELLIGILIFVAVFLANFLLGQAIRNKADKTNVNIDIQTIEGVD